MASCCVRNYEFTGVSIYVNRVSSVHICISLIVFQRIRLYKYYSIGTLITRIGSWGPVYYNINPGPPQVVLVII